MCKRLMKRSDNPTQSHRDANTALLHPLIDCAAGERRGQVECAVVVTQEMGGRTE